MASPEEQLARLRRWRGDAAAFAREVLGVKRPPADCVLSAEALATLEAAERRLRLYGLYPEEGPLRRELYVKHMEFFAAGAVHDERAFVGGNRTGKSFCICYEGVCHLIGYYPTWWAGRRYKEPIIAWAAGEDVKAVRESLQPTLLGPAEARGTGLIPGDALVRSPNRGGIPDAIDFVEVRYRDSKTESSRAVLKSYDQGRESFESARVDVVLLDEEPPLDIYTACLTRTMSTVPGVRNGLVMCAFTPLRGVSATVLQFLPGGAYPATEELRREAWGW